MSKDPFDFDDEDDRTVLRPRTPRSSDRAAGNETGRSSERHSATSSIPLLGGINSLENAASRLLLLLITIKGGKNNPDPVVLRNELIRELEDFKKKARGILEDSQKATEASYVMCTVLDEAVMNTPWGDRSNWSQHNLLARFHNAVAGGDMFYKTLKRLARDPRENIQLLELMYVCLSLGFGGKYRIAENGQDKLTKVRQWLYNIIQSTRERQDKALAANWRGSDVAERRLSRLTPLWVFAAGSLALASVALLFMRFSLGAHTDETIASFWAAEAAPLSVRTVVPPVRALLIDTDSDAEELTLTELLQDDIEADALEVIESYDNGKVRILGNNLFASGRSDLDDAYAPLIGRMAEAADGFDGRVIVIGHSDNVPIRSGRYASNQELSQSRAESVARQLSLLMDQGERVSFEGRGSLEPIADNATQAGRNANRRVEIIVYF